MRLPKLSLRTLVRNFYNLFVYDYHQMDVERRQQWVELRNRLAVDGMRLYFNENNPEPYQDELEYVYDHGFCPFPYSKLKQLDSVECGYDQKHRLPYVIHQGKRLFFPEDVSLEKVEGYYRRFIEEENLLGGNFTKRMPHCYQSENLKVEEGDVFVDLGAAEGLVALDVIDRVSKVYIIESERYWLKALRATFEPYKEKCVIVPKLVTDHDGKKAVTLEHLLKDEANRPVFVKMDIEGFEKKVVAASQEFLSRRENVKLACCTYHFEDDAKTLVSLFEGMGYRYEFSDGWMLFANYDKTLLNPPYFRHGVIRAWK